METTHYDSTMENAPVLNGTLGSGLALLDAILRTGFNQKTVSSLVRSGSIVTVTVNNGHAFKKDEIIKIEGAFPNDYNGRFRIKSVLSSTQFTYEISTMPNVSSGTITVKYPPLGWSRIFFDGDTRKAVYQSSNQQSTKGLLRIDDNNLNYFNVSMFESMTSLDAGLNEAYTFWVKSSEQNSSARPWQFFGDSKRFYFFSAPSTSYPTVMRGHFFGDLNTWKENDFYNCALIGCTDTYQNWAWSNSYPGYNNTFTTVDGTVTNNFLMRSFTQMGTNVNFGKISLNRGQMGYDGQSFPNKADNGIHLFPVYVLENASWRGTMPGLYAPLEPIRYGMITGDRTVKFPVNALDKEFYGLRLSVNGHTGDAGYCFFDEFGDWNE